MVTMLRRLPRQPSESACYSKVIRVLMSRPKDLADVLGRCRIKRKLLSTFIFNKQNGAKPLHSKHMRTRKGLVEGLLARTLR